MKPLLPGKDGFSLVNTSYDGVLFHCFVPTNIMLDHLSLLAHQPLFLDLDEFVFVGSLFLFFLYPLKLV